MERDANSINESQADKLPWDHAEGLSATSGSGGWGFGGSHLLPLPHISAPFGLSRLQLKSRTLVPRQAIAQLFNSIYSY